MLTVAFCLLRFTLSLDILRGQWNDRLFAFLNSQIFITAQEVILTTWDWQGKWWLSETLVISKVTKWLSCDWLQELKPLNYMTQNQPVGPFFIQLCSIFMATLKDLDHYFNIKFYCFIFNKEWLYENDRISILFLKGLQHMLYSMMAALKS